MSESIKKEVTTKDLFLYACGSGTIGVNNVVFGTYLLIYYNQVLGLNPALASLAISISLIFDAISDPLIGAWSDRVKTCLLYTSPSPRDAHESRMPSSA